MGSAEYAKIIQCTVAVKPMLVISLHNPFRPTYIGTKVYACTNTHIDTQKILTDFMSPPTENNLPIIFKNWMISVGSLSYLSFDNCHKPGKSIR